MLAFIALFFPAVVSVWLFESLAKTEFSVKQTIMRFCTNALLINFLCVIVKKFILGAGAEPLYTEIGMVPNVAAVYITMALIFGICIAVIEVVFSKKIILTVEEEPDESKKG